MGLFDIFKKKERDLVLPPPPKPMGEGIEPMKSFPMLPVKKDQLGDIAPIKGRDLEEEPQHEVYDKTLEAPEMELHMPQEEEKDLTKPVFVSIEDYKTIMGSLDSIKSKLSDAEEYLKKIEHLKQHGDKELLSWRDTLEDVEKKLSFVDEVVFTK